MERIIEFPLDHKSVFGGELKMFPGFSVCYQYDVTEHGFGPYGFATLQAKTLVEKVFNPLVYWDAERQKLDEVAFPYRAGIYFLENQNCLSELARDLSMYRQRTLISALRAKRGESKMPVSDEEPLLLRVVKAGKIQPNVIKELVRGGYTFIILHSYSTEAGKTFVFFDSWIREKILDFSKANNICYSVCSSIDDLTSW